MLKAAVFFQSVVCVCLAILLFTPDATIPFAIKTFALACSFLALSYIVAEMRKKKPF